MSSFSLEEVYRRTGGDPSKLTPQEAQLVLVAELGGGLRGELPFELAYERERCLDSPSFLATEVIDPFYKQHFERIHYVAMDEVMAPYMLGETVKLDGQSHEPGEYLGLIVLFARTTFKSTMMRLMVQWNYLHSKLRRRQDARVMYVHQVIEKAIEHGEAMRNVARHHRKWRERFPEFRAPEGEWDRQNRWRWPSFTTYMATEFSFVAYGESSSKTGGHYTLRVVDDWETEESVTTDAQMQKSHNSFLMMDNLKTKTDKFCPYLICGTPYHYQGTYKRLERDGGYLIWKVPAHTGSPKRIFDLCALDPRSEKDRLKIKLGIQDLERDPPGRLNFPHLISWRECYMMARGQRSYVYNCQQLLDPVPEGDQRFDHGAIDESWVDEIPGPEEMWLYLRVDPAISEKRKNDETAIVLGGVGWNAWRWSLDGWVGREKRPSVIVRSCFGLARKWQRLGYRVQNIGVESVQYQEALAQIMRDGVPEREVERHGESVPILKSPCPVRSIQRSPDMRKQERIMEMDGPIGRRELKIWRQNPIGARQAQQLKNFPFDRDDILDATHDLWTGTMVPPRAMPQAEGKLPKWLLKMMRQREPGQLTDTHNTATLAAWR